jgi:hypothetical protein
MLENSKNASARRIFPHFGGRWPFRGHLGGAARTGAPARESFRCCAVCTPQTQGRESTGPHTGTRSQHQDIQARRIIRWPAGDKGHDWTRPQATTQTTPQPGLPTLSIARERQSARTHSRVCRTNVRSLRTGKSRDPHWPRSQKLCARADVDLLSFPSPSRGAWS